MGLVCVVDGLILLYTKWRRGRMWFMLQPCNVWPPLLAFVCLWRSPFQISLFNFYLHVMWVSCAAVAVDGGGGARVHSALWPCSPRSTAAWVRRARPPLTPPDRRATDAGLVARGAGGRSPGLRPGV